jgi:hypothetical protein
MKTKIVGVDHTLSQGDVLTYHTDGGTFSWRTKNYERILWDNRSNDDKTYTSMKEVFGKTKMSVKNQHRVLTALGTMIARTNGLAGCRIIEYQSPFFISIEMI